MTGSIVGSWYVASPGGGTDAICFTFLSDGTFLVADKGTHANDPSGQSGLEYGTYTWNSATGAISFNFTVNTDGEWGLSNAGISTATVDGNTLTLGGLEGNFSIPRLTTVAGSIVGSWYVRNPPGDHGSDQLVFTFLPDGTYMLADKGTHANDPSGDNGIEWGTYTWDPVSGAFTSTTLVNTDGQWGLSHTNGEVSHMFVFGDTLQIGPNGDSINGVRLSPIPAVSGGTGGDVLFGTGANETFTGGAGNDSIDGRGGIDTAVYLGARAGYTVTKTSTGFTVANPGGGDGTDTLLNIERLQFSDVKVALDLAGNAGTTAKILGAVFGAGSVVAHPDYMGIGLSLLDGGLSYSTLMELAINVRLGPQASHAAVVDLLYTNVVGIHPGAADLAFYTGLLDAGTFTVGNLGVLAADTAMNAANIDLAGLSQTGVIYI